MCLYGGEGNCFINRELIGLFSWLTIGDVRKCTDEEHITYSGGSKIKDLAQCG